MKLTEKQMQVWLDGEKTKAVQGESIETLLIRCGKREACLAVLCAGELLDLRTPLQEGMRLHLVCRGSEIARQMKEKTLCFLMVATVKKLYPQLQERIEHGIDNGIYCEFDPKGLSPQQIDALRDEMRRMIAQALPIGRRYVKKEEAVRYFKELHMEDKAENIAHRREALCPIDTLDTVDDYFYGHLCLNTADLENVYVYPMKQGCWIGFHPDPRQQEKLYQVYDSYERWGKMLSVANVPQLNQYALHNGIDELILMSEAKIERELVELADRIASQQPFRRFVLISGPSSAGKTTFSHRLRTHLRVLGYVPHTIAMDDFFRNRSEYRLLEDGTPDFESIDALDLELLERTIHGLLEGKEMRMPYFDFQNGVRRWRRETMRIGTNDILIMEGIHGLNPKVVEGFAVDEVFRIYVNALTHLNLDAHTRIPTSDYRLIRRMVRDYQFRGYSAAQTLRAWKHVREGEDHNIYPYQEEADVLFNTSMVYEMLILKRIAKGLLEEIKGEDEIYAEAKRLLSLLQYFDEADSTHIPSHSILAEFVGNSVFFDK